jgi:two-component system chemotaxis response regulator CheY
MKTCLIVDDSRVIRIAAARMLVELGFAVDEAANGEEALAACRRRLPDVILLDWNMPVMNGIEFLRAVQGIGEPRPLVVFCTTETGMEFIQKALLTGADEYIMKPFDRGILESKFQQIGLLS